MASSLPRTSKALFIILFAVPMLLTCDTGTAPVLNDLVLKGISSRSITLERPTLAEAVKPVPSIIAYIGLTGTIAVNGDSVSGSTGGPADVSACDYQFKNLTLGSSYDIIVIAKNSAGYSVKKLQNIKTQVPVITTAVYPVIEGDEMAMLRWYLSVCDDALSDFTRIEGFDEVQFGLTSYRYAIAFLTYYLAAEQYHKLPACFEIIQPRMDRLIQKMMEKPVWDYWAERSQGIEFLEPFMNKPYPEERDPVVDENIMYSGHLGQMIASYEMLYKDLKYSQPGSIVFRWSDSEKYVYDNNSLQKVMYDQMAGNWHRSIECEPNAVFPECNQHPILSFFLYDAVHGTKFAEARKDYLDFHLMAMLISPVTHENCLLYLVKQKVTIHQEFANFGNAFSLLTIPLAWVGALNFRTSIANGWTGTFMHAWEPDYIERHYVHQKRNHLIDRGDGTAYIKAEMIYDQMATPFFALLAAEVGDMDARDKMVAWCKGFYLPTMENGMLHYPVTAPAGITLDKVNCPNSVNMTGILIAYALANPSYGMWNFINRPFTERNFSSPRVTGIDYPNVLLKRAIYDFEKEALVVTTAGGTAVSGTTTYTITQLDPGREWELFIDGVSRKKVSGTSSLTVEVSLEGAHTAVLVGE